MRILVLLGGPLLLLGCPPPSGAKDAPADTATADTATPADTGDTTDTGDTVDTADTADTADTDDTSVPAEPVSVDADGAPLLPSEGTPYDQFGATVAVSGRYAVVGAPTTQTPGEDEDGWFLGAVYVYERVEDAWVERAVLRAPEADWDRTYKFGTGLAIDGDRIVAAGYTCDTYACSTEPGRVWVFERDGDDWPHVATLDDPNADPWQEFGNVLAVSGDTIFVSAVKHGVDGNESDYPPGAVWVFERDGADWVEQGFLRAEDAWFSDTFGAAIDAEGDTVVIGAPQEDGGPDNPLLSAGSAYVFTRGDAGWTQAAQIVAPDAVAGDYFGWSVSLSGGRLLVGAPFASAADGVVKEGAAYLFEGAGDRWDFVTTLSPSDPQDGDNFGASVALDGNFALVGAYLEAGGAGDPYRATGTAYGFTSDGGVWTEVARLGSPTPLPDDWYGWSVAADAGNALVGARYAGADDPAEVNRGAAYAYTYGP